MPYQLARVGEDEGVVRVFFLASCGFCRMAHAPMAKWGKSLPSGLRFEATPVVTRDPAHSMAASAYYAAVKVAPDRADAFMEEVYAALQDRRQSANDPRTYAEAARTLGIDMKRFVAAAGSNETREKVVLAARLLARYRIDTTPSMTVGGRYVVNTETTQGINANLIDLLNAVTSKYLQETGKGPT